MVLTPPDDIIEFVGTSAEDTEMAVGDVRLPGVYEITETGKGMTAKYMAEQAQASGAGAGGEYTDIGGDQEEDSYDTGTLLVGGDPVLDENGDRVIIAEDGYTGESYDVDGGATILGEATDDYEAGQVIGADGEPINDSSDPPQPMTLAEGGYTIATGEETEDEDEGEDEGEDEDEGEGEDEGDDAGGGPTQTEGDVAGTLSPEVVPEGFDSLSTQPLSLTVRAYCSDDTWESLDEMREQDAPFDVAIGPFYVERMGILDLSRTMAGGMYAANDVTIKLKQFREVTVQMAQGGGPTDTTDTDAEGGEEGPVFGWVDANNDGIADEGTEFAGEEIPEYEEVTLDGGETYTANVESGELWGNKLIDASADGASVNISADGDDWVIKNVGIRGTAGTGPTIDAAANGGQGVVENVYAANGGAGAAVNVPAGMDGTLIINRVNAQDMAGGGILAQAPGGEGGGGTVEIYNTYAEANTPANFRVGTDGGFCENCVSIHTEGGSPNGITGENTETEVRESNIRNTTQGNAIQTASGGSITLSDTAVDGATSGDVSGESAGDVTVSLPAGVPDSVSQGARGTEQATQGGGSEILYENFESGGYASHFTSANAQGAYDSLASGVSYEGSQSLEVQIPAGNHRGISAKHEPSDNPTLMTATYWVRFSPNFDASASAGKLPGFAYAPGSVAKGGDPADGTSWSARGSFFDAGGGVGVGYYVYHLDQSGRFGDFFDGPALSPGEWYKIHQRIVLNTVSGGSANSDGELHLTVDGNSEISRTNMRFTNDRSNGINYWFNVYYGGSSPSPTNQSVFFDNWSLTGGDA